jgi:hypothetical protein
MDGFVSMLQQTKKEKKKSIFNQYKLLQIIEYVNDYIKGR